METEVQIGMNNKGVEGEEGNANVTATECPSIPDERHQHQEQEEQQREMKDDEQQVVSALYAVAATNGLLLETDRCICVLAELQRERHEEAELAKGCERMESTLREEHRLHQEELKQINQDINQLDTIMRSLRTQHAQQTPELGWRIAEFEARLTAIENGIDNGKIVDHSPSFSHVNQSTQSSSQNLALIGNQSQHQLQWFLTFFHQFQLLQQQQQLQQQQAQQQQNQQQSNHWQMVASSRQQVTPIVVPNAQQQAKMKACQHCLKEIHRNAPTCPYCKQKITSKAAKRARKKQE